MTAKQLKGKRWKFHPINEAENIGYVTQIKPRKPSPAKKPEKIWVVQEQRLNSKKWGVAMYRFSYPLAKKTLKEWRHHVPSRKFRLREYTAGKVLKD